MIKVWDYLKEYELLRDDILKAVDDVFKGGTLIFGPKLEEFEEKFSKYCDSKHGIGVGGVLGFLIGARAQQALDRDLVCTG